MEEKRERQALPSVDRDGFELDSGERLNRAHPETFWIPSANERHNLLPGQIVKLIFHIAIPGETAAEQDVYVHRRWVKVTGKNGNLYMGELDSHPYSDDLK